MTCLPLRWLAAAVTIVVVSPLGAAEVLRLEFENSSNFAEDSSGNGVVGTIAQTATNFFGALTGSSDVRPGSTGSGSANFDAFSASEGFYLDFGNDAFPDFGPTDSWTLSLWLKPTTEYIADGQGFRSSVSGLSENANTALDWQFDNGNTVDGGAGNGTTTLASFNYNGVQYDFDPNADLVPDQWQQVTIGYIAEARVALFYIDGVQTNGLSFGANGGLAMERFLVGVNRGLLWVYDGLMDDLVLTDEASYLDPTTGDPRGFGDLDFDGDIDADDWEQFKGFQGAPGLGDLTITEQYTRGDLDFDGDNDLDDFGAFKSVYNAANGAESFSQMLATVPEPTSFLLTLGSAVALLVRRREPRLVPAELFASNRANSCTTRSLMHRPRLAVLPLMLAFVLGSLPHADAQSVLFDFGNGDVDANTGVAANFIIPDADPLGALTNTQGGVEMSLLGITTSTPGTYDSNSQGFGIVSSGDANSAGAQRRLDTAEDGETVQFSFDTDVILSSLRVGALESADEGFQLGFVSGDDPFAGGSFSYTTSDNGATEGPTFDISLGDIAVTAGTVLEFSTLNEGGGGILWNDLNVFVGQAARPITLQALSNGELRLLGGTLGGASPPPGIEIDAIQITSADTGADGGSLNPAGFTGIGGDALFPVGDGSGNGWEPGLANTDAFISELYLEGSSTILTDQEVALGNAFLPGGEQDLSFSYRDLSTGETVTGLVEYLTVAGQLGDFNNDGVVDAADYTVYRNNQGDDEAALGGNGDGSGTVDAADLALWQANYGAGSSSAAAIPEPTTLVLLVAVAGFQRSARRKQG